MSKAEIEDATRDVREVMRRRTAGWSASSQEYLLAQLTEQASKPTREELFDRINKEHSGGRMTSAHAAQMVRAGRDARSG